MCECEGETERERCKDAIAKARREGAISVSLPGVRDFAFPLRERSLFETDNIYVHVGSERFTINT